MYVKTSKDMQFFTSVLHTLYQVYFLNVVIYNLLDISNTRFDMVRVLWRVYAFLYILLFYINFHKKTSYCWSIIMIYILFYYLYLFQLYYILIFLYFFPLHYISLLSHQISCNAQVFLPPQQ